ncbi:hypothetical protein FJ366_03525, partial [Candidatus Dependentiae bacterium]|nr:hypothetical protein [Candidatus Dependentiae bacterium]
MKMLYWYRLGLMFVISMSGLAFSSSNNTLSSEPVRVNFGDWGKSLSDDFYKFLSNSILVFGGSSPEATKLDELKNRTSNLKKELEVFNQAVQGAVPVVQDSSASSAGSSLGSSTTLPLPGATTSLPSSTMTAPASLPTSSAGSSLGSSTTLPLPGATTSLPSSTMTAPASLPTSSAGSSLGSSTS